MYEIGRDTRYTDEMQSNPCSQGAPVTNSLRGQGRLLKEEAPDLVLEGWEGCGRKRAKVRRYDRFI